MAKREHIPPKLRHEVFQRDNYRCRECGATNKETTLHIDHIKPVSKGGTNDINNLQTLCEKCNLGKYTDEWIGGKINQKNSNINHRIGEKRRRKVEERNNQLYNDIFPKITPNQFDNLRHGNFVIENANKEEIVRYLVNNFSEDEIYIILNSIDKLELQRQEIKNKSKVSYFCILRYNDICYYYYKLSSEEYGRFYDRSEEELKQKILSKEFPWIDVEEKTYDSLDNFINQIYLRQSIGKFETIHASSKYITSDELMEKALPNLGFKKAAFSHHGYHFCKCGKRISSDEMFCSECKPPTELFEPVDPPKFIPKFKICPNCGKEIKENAIRCRYCKTILKKY